MHIIGTKSGEPLASVRFPRVAESWWCGEFIEKLRILS
jgi:hypothetical protein